MFSLPHATSPRIFALYGAWGPANLPFPLHKLSIDPSTPILPLLSPFLLSYATLFLSAQLFAFRQEPRTAL